MSAATAARGRTLVLSLCGITFVVLCVSIASNFYLPWYGSGIDYRATSSANVLRVTGVDSAEFQAGVRRGDLIDIRGQVFDPARATMPHELNVVRQGRSLTVRLPPEYARGNLLPGLLYFLSQFWVLAFAVLIAVRGRDARGIGILATALAADALGWGLYAMVTPAAWTTALMNGVGLAVTPVARFVLLTHYFSSFARPLQGARLWWTRLAYGAAAISVLAVVMLYGYVFDVGPFRSFMTDEAFELLFECAIVPVLVCGIVAARSARAEDSARIAWVTGSYGIFFTFWVCAGSLGFLWGAYFGLMWQIEAVSHLFVPLGLSYAALRRRVFDIGFVLNRAAIFTAVSLIVIGAFVLLEWSLGTWLGSLDHAASLALNVALALVLGVSLRFVHARVERVIDAVFFRKRHEDERALRSFAREAAYITNGETLLDRTASTIERYADVSSVRILLEGALSSPALENDPAILKLKAWSEPVDLHVVDTVLEGDWAYPMIARGRLAGVLLLGPRRSSESYAPDEAEAIAEIARGVAGALEALDEKRSDGVDAVLHAIDALRSEVRIALNARQP